MDDLLIEEQSGVKGAFVGNASRDLQPSVREVMFDPNNVAYGKAKGMVILRTVDLYCVVMLKLTENLDQEGFWKEFFECVGEFEAASSSHVKNNANILKINLSNHLPQWILAAVGCSYSLNIFSSDNLSKPLKESSRPREKNVYNIGISSIFEDGINRLYNTLLESFFQVIRDIEALYLSFRNLISTFE
jgi:hypothetical protein